MPNLNKNSRRFWIEELREGRTQERDDGVTLTDCARRAFGLPSLRSHSEDRVEPSEHNPQFSVSSQLLFGDMRSKTTMFKMGRQIRSLPDEPGIAILPFFPFNGPPTFTRLHCSREHIGPSTPVTNFRTSVIPDRIAQVFVTGIFDSGSQASPFVRVQGSTTYTPFNDKNMVCFDFPCFSLYLHGIGARMNNINRSCIRLSKLYRRFDGRGSRNISHLNSQIRQNTNRVLTLLPPFIQASVLHMNPATQQSGILSPNIGMLHYRIPPTRRTGYIPMGMPDEPESDGKCLHCKNTHICAICLTEYCSRRPLMLINCGHVFCTQCLRKFINCCLKCPNCYKLYGPERIVRLSL